MKTKPSKPDAIRLIRNATLHIDYAGKRILLDPMFSSKGALGSIAGEVASPTVTLPFSIDRILDSVDMVLLTHTHLDHFDQEAINHLEKSIFLVHQPIDYEKLSALGFTNTKAIEQPMHWGDIKIIPVKAQHGTGRVLEMMGEVTGYVLQSEMHPTVYVVGDGIWTQDVFQNIVQYKPDIIVANTGGARFLDFKATNILMDEDDVFRLLQESNQAKVIAVHMDAIDHCLTTRASLRAAADKAGITADRLIIPEDGELVMLD